MIKKLVKSIATAFFPSALKKRYYLAREMQYRYKISLKDALKNYRLITDDYKVSKSESFKKQFKKITSKVNVDISSFYIYPLDKHIVREMRNGVTGIVSITVDFGKILKSDLNELTNQLSCCSNTDFKEVETSIIKDIKKLNNRILTLLNANNSSRAKVLSQYFERMLFGAPRSLDEALQKILFYNALFWQMRHYHIGLGRLDKILLPYYEADIKSGKLNREEAKKIIYQFCRTLHHDYHYKSVSLLGDTGQYILLGGIDNKGEEVSNEITELFLELFAESPMADPKLILRVNDHTPNDIWQLAVKSLVRGSGSPLLMNEDVVMKNMIDFGYKAEDVSEVGTSACWEPLIIGKSFDQNNPFISANALKPIRELLLEDSQFVNFDDFKQKYFSKLKTEIQTVVKATKDFDVSPLFTLFFDDCIAREKDFADGGATYAHHGAQVVGLPNAVNALINIKNLVFDKKIITVTKLTEALKSNFDGFEDIRLLLLSSEQKFGSDNQEVIDISNEIMSVASSTVEDLTCNDTRLKVGFSSPGYITCGVWTDATPDGRKDKEPFAVHISPQSSEIDLASIMRFASKLDYSGNRLNGNVVDFIIPTSFRHYPEKLISILKDGFRNGVFEMQLNVLDKATLIDAKAHPEKYPDLIVRVWGFSAYFNELPEKYKDNLIERATVYESA